MTTTPPDPVTEQQRRAKSDRYAQLSQRLLKHAQEQLALGDTVQASEKAYGAVAHAVKACGELRGWNHYNHYRVGLTLDQLREEWNDPSLVTLHMAVKALHDNFFEYEMSTVQVNAGINAAKEIADKLEMIRNSLPRPLSSSSLSQEQRRRLSLLMQPPALEQIAAEDLPPLENFPE